MAGRGFIHPRLPCILDCVDVADRNDALIAMLI
jgi:hypothetical protein